MSMLNIEMRITQMREWRVSLDVRLRPDSACKPVDFKVDSGCNTVLLSHVSLKLLGMRTIQEELGRLPKKEANIATGEIRTFKSLGKVALSLGGVSIGEFDAICHPTRQTKDLLGSNVLMACKNLGFKFGDMSYMTMELL